MSRVPVLHSLDDRGIARGIGEVWIDRAGNECFYRDNGSISCRTVNDQESLTVQSEKDSCDFNLIYAKYVKSGFTLMTNLRTDQPMFGDFSNSCDYHESVERAQATQDLFMTLPADIRARFSNDPGQLIDFLGSEDNRAEAIKLGLVNPPHPDEVDKGGTKTDSQESV